MIGNVLGLRRLVVGRILGLELIQANPEQGMVDRHPDTAFGGVEALGERTLARQRRRVP